MEEMVEQMLDYTATQLGRGIPMRPAPADLNDVLRDAVEEIRMTHADCRVGLETEGDLRGEWDEGRIRQAIANLLDNAVRHARDCAVRIHARADESGREIVIAVHNHGTPISPRERARIFEPFQRASSDGDGNSRSDNGLGLGLYIAREIVAAHGGRIEVASSDADGTTFSIHLPREHASVAVRQPQPSP
jgi:signal transduction histidine kinase